MELDIIEMTIEGIKDYRQISFAEMGIGYETIKLEDNSREDVFFMELSDEERADYEKYKVERRKKELAKFKRGTDRAEAIREKAHIDPDWQKEIMQDVLDELRY